MTPETREMSIKLASVRAACERATAGPRKDTAWKHYRLAELAQSEENDAEMYKELDAAKLALV
ncbi:hypothetical protein [Phaeobacter inhibens]|uniref:hypothetical protein n=1 Tax=Phaeobacter inhibens TaxID=221822 RepID=UPI00076BB6C8|nr:hypothetical protein [Phaeobacter inhibens]KXF90125.1 hypothetical protein AT574_13210 [Phaeobacter inhibens]WHP67386.1 hypothetical protein QMZ01_12640 [Phaeobacter inhibens]